MKKFFLLCAAMIAAVAVSAKEITVDLSQAKGYTHAESGSGEVALADGVLTVNWVVETGWEVAGTEIPLDNLEGVSKLNFDYAGDGGGTTMYVYLRDSEGNRWWNEDGYGLSAEDWTPVEFVPASPLWDAPGYELGEKPFVSIGFIANPAEPTNGVFKLREVKITVEGGEVIPEPVEGGVIYKWSNVEAEQVGVTFFGASGVSVDKVKIHANTDEVPAIKFANSYKVADGKYIAIKPAEGGFKAGDELQIAICYSNDAAKEAQAAIYAADTETQLFLSEMAINARMEAADPAIEKFVLESDQDSLLIGRKGGTSLFAISLQVVRGEGGEEPPVEEHALKGSQFWPILLDGTTIDANESKMVASFQADDVSQFLYVWDGTYSGGEASGLNFYGNQDGYLSLVVNAGWAGCGFCLTDAGNGWQAAEALRAAIIENPNDYFLHLAIKATDNGSHCFYLFGNEGTKFVLGSNAVYDGPIYKDFTRNGEWQEFDIPLAPYANALASQEVVAGVNVFVALSEGVPGIQLNLDAVYIYKVGGEEPPVVGPAKPEAAPAAPAEDEANVMAVFCNYYANNNANFGISGWAGAYELIDLDGTIAAYWEGYTWECIIDPAHIDDAHDFSAWKNLHVDIWAPAAAKIKLQAEAVAGGNYKDGVVIELQEGWNSVNIALEAWPGGYDFKNLKCFAVDGYKTPADESFEGNPLAIANLYFFGTDTPVTPPADEKEVIYSWEDEIGETVLGASGVELSTVKIHENADEVPAIKFSSSYVFDDGKYIAIKPAEGGFKAGDELQIAICFNNSSDDKNAQADIFAADGATELFLSEPGINGRTNAADPAVQKYVLESDQETLYIGRKGNTAMCVISLKVLRGEGGEEPPVVGPVKPEEAPAVPTHEAEDVLAINCATYEANLNWYPQWWGGSNVQWENLEFDKTIVYYTPQIAFDGITNAENSPVDVSGYEKFHFDVWVPQASHIMITFEGASGYKQGVDFKLNEGWNTIDADPAWWSDRQAYDWKDVKFVIFEGYKLADSENIDECTPASDKPFAFANFYWWKSPAPKNLPEAPAAPTMAEDHVQALFSASYLNNTFNFAPTSWGSQWIKVDYENGQSIWFSESFGWDGFTNGEADHYELSEEMDMMHADVYVTVDSKLKFTFEALSGWKNGLAVEGLKANQWNSVTLDLLNAPFDSYDFKDLRYLILEGFVKEADGSSAEGTPLGIANVYFYSSINEGVENVGAEQKAVKRIINGQLMIEKNGVLYNVLGTKF